MIDNSGVGVGVSKDAKKSSLKQKLQHLKDLRHEIKKKRIFLNEDKDKFGMEEMSQLIKVKNTSEVKGYPFRLKHTEMFSSSSVQAVAVKVVPVETKYDKKEHPCNLENLVLRELTENVVNTQISPHVTYYLGTQKVGNKSRALKHLNLKRLEVEGKIKTHSNMLISEYVDGGSLDNWVFNVYENDGEISDEQWRNIVFQLVYTIAIIQTKYKMMHNDCHYGNILIDDNIEPGGYFVYEVYGKTYYLKNTGVIPKLWDCEFCMVYSDNIKDCYPNKFITGPYSYDKKTHTTIIDHENQNSDEELNVPYNYNEVYDIHYFLTSLLDLYVSKELFDWIISLYPAELIPADESSNSSYSQGSSSLPESDTDTDNSDTTESESTKFASTDSEPLYLNNGRLYNGVENDFDLPNPSTVLSHPFFKSFLTKPSDFDPETAMFFKAGF
jgi:hypothetical protein